jgi:hypothetical protein
MNIQFIRLDDEVCEVLNRLAEDQRRRVSEVVNEILREQLEKIGAVSHVKTPPSA